jgi:uncharacterized protein (DUF934 family)
MAKIWTPKGFLDNNAWGYLSDDAQFMTLEDFLSGNEINVALRIEPADDVMLLADHLDRIGIIALNFPMFSDGRAFSHGALLRDRLKFEGEVRAFGHVLLDQVPLMLRCGISSFEVSDDATIKHLKAGHIPAISHHYQPSMNEPAKANSYSWRYMASLNQ